MIYSKYVDPKTGGYVILEGNQRRISDKLFRTFSLLFMKAGSVPNDSNQFFNCGIRDITKSGSSTISRIKAQIDKALAPWKNTASVDGLYDSYSREVTKQGNFYIIKVTIQNASATESLTVPLE